jgi:hypothetical protein
MHSGINWKFIFCAIPCGIWVKRTLPVIRFWAFKHIDVFLMEGNEQQYPGTIMSLP